MGKRPRMQFTTLVVTILLLGAVLRFWGLSSADVQGDLALNSFRTVGWFDYVGEEGQTTPIIWFGTIPQWATLSFHDHPPLVFFIQHIFFKLFGDYSYVAFLPFAIAGVVTALMIFLIMRAIRTRWEALLSLLIFSISSYAIWASRTGYLEGMQVVFLVLSFSMFLMYLHKQKRQYLVFWGIASGLALLTKYTSLFLLPAVFLYILLWDRRLLRNRWFWLSLALAAVLLIPVIIYNYNVFATRGHFDAALSSMLNMHPDDYISIATRTPSVSIANITSLWHTLKTNLSIPFFTIVLVSIIVLVVTVVKKGDAFTRFLTVTILSLLAMFLFAPSSSRFLTIAMPFLSISYALLIVQLWSMVHHAAFGRYTFVAVFTGIVLFELFYAINTNLLTSPLGSPVHFWAPDRVYNKGFEKLDRFLRTNAYGEFPSMQNPALPRDLRVDQQDVILIDERSDWFSQMWYFRRYLYYYNFPMLTFYDFWKMENINQIPIGDEIAYLAFHGTSRIWFVYVPPTKHRVTNKELYDQKVSSLVRRMEDNNIKPVIITDDRGVEAFYVYSFAPSEVLKSE